MSAFGGKADIALGSSHLALTREKKLKLGTRGRLFGDIGLEGVASFELRLIQSSRDYSTNVRC